VVVGIGVDIVEVERIRRALEGSGAMVRRVFTEEEIQYCTERKNRFQHFAGRFAAKEAALKALGTGWQEGIRWKDVEVVAGELGAPQIRLSGKARERFEKIGADRAHVTITHAEAYAVSVVLLESNPGKAED
jgi:holo-[acyl-carrier protein] synthase